MNSLHLLSINKEVGVRVAYDIAPNSIDCIVTSPPYKTKDGYSDALMYALGDLMHRYLKPCGIAFVNFGQLKEDFQRPFYAQSEIARSHGVEPGQTIIWAKSIAIDGVQKGHFQPINSKRILNYCWEFIFTFYRGSEPELDRLSIGVPYSDKSNLKRGTRGKNGDLHCGGDIWFVPYKTTGASKKKRHRYEFPEELVERCLKVSGLKPGDTVLDPFGGSGTTAAVAKRLGLNAVIIDKNAEHIASARKRWEEVPSEAI